VASHDALRHISIGQYIPGEGPIYRLDPRAKLVGAVLLTVAVVLATGYLPNILLLATITALLLSSGLSLRYSLASVRPALPMIVVLAFFQILFYSGPGSEVVWLEWGWVRISAGAVRIVTVSIMRLIDLILLTALVTNTTTTGALTHGLEGLLSPLDRIGLPGHALAMVGAIALRFLPILGEQLESIMQAHASRDVRPSEQRRWRIVENARTRASLIIPLFVDAYRRSEELTMAMQARCYQGGRGRTHLHLLKMTAPDYVVILGATLFLVATLILQYAA
jgi:energy-coupling factor transport system permease protein